MEIKYAKASYDYYFDDTVVAGIVLSGTEIKSIRNGNASLVDSYCIIENGEMCLRNSYIKQYEMNGYKNHEERRDRKLLLHKHEIRKRESKVKQKGYSIIPTKMYIDKNGMCKVVVNLARGKKSYDKRESIREKDINRAVESAFKNIE